MSKKLLNWSEFHLCRVVVSKGVEKFPTRVKNKIWFSDLQSQALFGLWINRNMLWPLLQCSKELFHPNIHCWLKMTCDKWTMSQILPLALYKRLFRFWHGTNALHKESLHQFSTFSVAGESLRSPTQSSIVFCKVFSISAVKIDLHKENFNQFTSFLIILDRLSGRGRACF